MKKAIAILLSLTMILGLAACGNSASQTEQPSTEDTSVESKADTNSAESRTAEFEPESEATQPDDTEETEPAPETDTESEGTKVLVVYFSATNTTEGVAEHIANGLNADIYEIVPEDPYHHDGTMGLYRLLHSERTQKDNLTEQKKGINCKILVEEKA